MNPEERSAAILGAFDGTVSLVGLVFGLLIAHASRGTIRLTGIGATLSATVSMSTGSYESAAGAWHKRLQNAGAMGISTLIGSLVPIIAFFWFGRTTALIISAVGCLAVAWWIGMEKRKSIEAPRWFSGYASAFGTIVAAAGITLGVVSAIGGGG
jgi:VIT1/CCC1 family predicted Fe2+/Mn2+ transporter